LAHEEVSSYHFLHHTSRMQKHNILMKSNPDVRHIEPEVDTSRVRDGKSRQGQHCCRYSVLYVATASPKQTGESDKN
jgi:hypothetical protein